MGEFDEKYFTRQEPVQYVSLVVKVSSENCKFVPLMFSLAKLGQDPRSTKEAKLGHVNLGYVYPKSIHKIFLES